MSRLEPSEPSNETSHLNLASASMDTDTFVGRIRESESAALEHFVDFVQSGKVSVAELADRASDLDELKVFLEGEGFPCDQVPDEAFDRVRSIVASEQPFVDDHARDGKESRKRKVSESESAGTDPVELAVDSETASTAVLAKVVHVGDDPTPVVAATARAAATAAPSSAKRPRASRRRTKAAPAGSPLVPSLRSEQQRIAYLASARHEKDKKNFERMFALLVEFKKKHGHCTPTMNMADTKGPDAEFPRLGQWASRMREAYRNMQLIKQEKQPSSDKRISDENIQRLTEIGFQWDRTRQSKWHDRFQELLAYKETHGHCFLRSLRNNKLGRWALAQRERRLALKDRTSLPESTFAQLHGVPANMCVLT